MLTRVFLNVSQFYKCSTSYEISSGKTTFDHTYMVLKPTYMALIRRLETM